MAWTHFKITEFGTRTTPKINGVNAVIDTWYLSTDVLTIEKNNANHLGEPFDVLKYRATDGTNQSNIANLLVNCPPNKTIEPTSSNQVVLAANETLYDVIDSIPYSNGVDRIRIVEFETNGNLTLNGSNLFPNLVVFHYDFENIKYFTNLGTGEPYQLIKYQVGNIDGFNPTIYELTYNIVGEATLDHVESDFETLLDDDEVTPIARLQEYDFDINNGRVNGNALISIEYNLTNAWNDPENEISLNVISEEIPVLANGIYPQLVDLDTDGKLNIALSLYVVASNSLVTGTIEVTLLEINGDPLLVGTPNTILYNVSF